MTVFITTINHLVLKSEKVQELITSCLKVL
jgi:hypothetical protein